jgi:hypothetical protein
MAGGRPTKYDPAYCDKVIDMGKYGASKHEMALDLDINYSTFILWQETHEEFSNAVKEAMAYSQAWWEKNGRTATFGSTPGFNATSFIFNMKNRFKDDWRDKVETDLNSQSTVKTIDVTDKVLSQIPSDQLEQILAATKGTDDNG